MCSNTLMTPTNARIKPFMTDEDQELIQKGVDIWMIRDNLRLSPEARAVQHQDTLKTIETLERLRDKKRARPSSTPQVTDSNIRSAGFLSDHRLGNSGHRRTC